MAYGSLITLDTLAATNNTTVASIGEDAVFRGVEAARVAHNGLLMDAMTDLVDDTTDRLRRYGGTDDTEFDEVGEGGRADAAKLSLGTNVGFPLRKYQRSLQWNREYFENVSGAEFASQVSGILDADARNVYRQIRRAIFNPTNVNFTDRLTDSVVLPLKAFVNADSADMPLGPNGETFTSSTHTHYLFTAGTTLTPAAVDGLIDTVLEHYPSGMPILEINLAQVSTISNQTNFPQFSPYVDMRVIVGSGTTIAKGALETVNIGNRAIGVYRGAEVWVKPRVPAGYLFAWVKGAPKPLVFRRPERSPGRGDLRLVADNEAYPLRAQTRERNFGIGVWNRTNGAVLYIDSGAASAYVAPVI